MIRILMGVLLFLFVKNRFNTQDVIRDIRKMAKAVRGIVRDLIRTIRRSVREGKQELREERRAEKETGAAEEEGTVRAEQTEVRTAEDLPEEPERTALAAAMLARVPTLDFPKDDPKYDSSKKYRTAW